MKTGARGHAGLLLALTAVLISQSLSAQPGNGAPRMPMTIEPDPRTTQESYYFEEAGMDMPFVLYVSSKVSNSEPTPLVIALHGLGGDGNFLLRGKLVDLAEEHGYIVAAPLGYNVGGWYGSPVIVFGGGEVDPPNLAELSEQDVMNVLALMQDRFNVDPDRTYLMGHSMGGAGTIFLGQKHTDTWAALAAIAPAAFMMQPNREEILSTIGAAGIPLMIIQGDADTVVPPENTRAWSSAMDTVDIESEYIELVGGDHGTVIADGMEDIFRFFGSHTR